MKYQAPFFGPQFIDADGSPLAYGKLYTYLTGTTTNQATYQDQAGTVANTNPIILGADGRCSLWLDASVEYRLKLHRADDSHVKTWDDVTGSASSGSAVSSVNTLTGAVVLGAEDIAFSTGTSTTWFVGADVAAALDAVIVRANGAVTAASVSITDSGSYYTGTTVEAALQEAGAAAANSTGRLLRTSIFTSSGTWTKGSDVGRIVIEGVGGGGGAGASAVGLGGAGAGGYFLKTIVSPSASYVVTIGAGGAAGANGSDTTMAGCTASGGGLAPTIIGGAGGGATGGDLNLTGGGGGFGGAWSSNNYFGSGGNSYLGGGAVGNINASTGSAGVPSTGGGASGGTATGAIGGSGLVIVREYS